MKKFILRLFFTGVLVLSLSPVVHAETMQVMALSEFSTDNPSEFIEFQVYNDVSLSPELDLRAGYSVKAKVTDVVSPKRLKRNAKFSVIPVSYTDFDGVEHPISEEFVGKYSPKFEVNKGQLAKNAALTVGNYFVKGLSLGYHAVEGMVKNEEDNRLKSGVVSVYESTPLSLANNGQEIQIKKYDFFSFKFKNDKDDEEDEDDEVEDKPVQQTVSEPNQPEYDLTVPDDITIPDIPEARLPQES